MYTTLLWWFTKYVNVDVQTGRKKMYWDFRINGYIYEIRYDLDNDRSYTVNDRDYSEDDTADVGVPVWGY